MRLLLPLLLGCASSEPPVPRDSGSPPSPSCRPRPLRVVSWNVQGLGVDRELDATVDVLRRIDADVVALQEVDETEDATLEQLAADLQLPLVHGGTPGYGPLRNAVLSRLDGVAATRTSAALADDPDAFDVTRHPVTLDLQLLDGRRLSIANQHAKAGFDAVDGFRRVVDLWRTALATDAAADVALVVGDLNADPSDPPPGPRYRSIPEEVPPGYTAGRDLRARLEGPGLSSDPFVELAERGFEPLDLRQRDGSRATRDSGRWIDHLLLGGAAVVLGTEIYDSRDEDEPPGLPLAGSPPDGRAVREASDHLPVFVDLEVCSPAP